MKRVMVSALVVLGLVAGCTGRADVTSADEPAATMPTPPPTQTAPSTNAPADKPEPQAYVPAAAPGSAADYAELVSRLEQLVPAELRNEVPWPDLRNPNPVVAQVEIFDLWIWMTENLPEPQLVEIMSAPGSPSREQVVSVFGEIDAANVLERRPAQPYRAFDHRVVTFASAGLPLWLARDVPENAVVVYYSDSSGPVEVVDQESGAIVDTFAAVSMRSWLSIMVPTHVGWQLWRDQLIEPNDSELQVPDVPPPGAADVPPQPEL